MFTKQEWSLMAVLACIQFSHIVDFVIMMPLGPQLMRTFNIDPHQFGMLVSSYTFSAGISGLLASLFIDKFDRKSILLFFYVGFGLSTIACAMSNTYWLLFFARSIAGVFGGVLSSLVLSIVGDAIAVEKRGTAFGIVMGSFSIASILGIPFSMYLANNYDWHAPFVFLGILSCLICFLVFFTIPSMKNHLKGPHKGGHGLLHALIHILRTRNQLLALTFIFSLIFSQFCIVPFLSPSFVANAGMKESELPLIYLVGGIVSMFSSPLFGRLSDKFGRKKIFLIAALLSIFPLFVITNLGPHSLPVLLFIVSCFFFAAGGRMVPATAMVSATATPQFRGSFMSVSSSVQQMAAALGSYIAGMVVIKNEAGNLLNYNYVGYMAIAFTFVAIALSRSVKSTDGGLD